MIIFILLFSNSLLSELTTYDLFSDLETVRKVDKEIKDQLPFYYNYYLMGGYFQMPSSRMAPEGNVGIGAGKITTNSLYGINLQVFKRLELSVNYRDCKISKNNTERVGNFKFGILLPEDGFPHLPALTIGMNDFLGADRFDSPYVVATKQFLWANLELSLGYGWKRMNGVFGGVAWTPFRKEETHQLSVLAEYDAICRRFNWGLAYLGWDTLQASISQLHHNQLSGSLSIRYPLGSTKGFLPKTSDPKLYHSPVDTQPLGALRKEKELAQELAYGFSDQGLDLYTVYLTYEGPKKRVLWMKVVNNRYRNEQDVRKRIQNFLASILPSNIDEAIVVVEADGLPVNGYRFKRLDLSRYRFHLITPLEMEFLSPLIEAVPPPGVYDRTLLFQRTKEIWTFTARPRLLTFFGSSTGKFKYNLSAIAVPEGYLFDEVYYRIQAAYSVLGSSFDQELCQPNPSQLPNVRTDTLGYYHPNQLSLEQGYLQKGWNLRQGWFARLAAGYFEIAYGGVAAEVLYYPVGSNWAVGLEAATLLKRRYKGLAFTHKITKFKGNIPKKIHFIGEQYFLDLYYNLHALQVDFKFTLGQFLAKDLGIRIEVGRTFSSGLRFSVWSTFTNGHDRINGKTYYDKGFAFCMPLDWFLKQSSRTFIGNSISAWLRDVGAQAATGKTLYTTISEERYSEGICDCAPPGY